MSNQSGSENLSKSIRKAKRLLNSLDFNNYSCDSIEDIGDVIAVLADVQSHLSTALGDLSIHIKKDNKIAIE